eukprot:m.883897 g.883897  ORF g.883897 m.883897 type:complete len:520 (+) comp23613_c0_seq1:164-1723(+)
MSTRLPPISRKVATQSSKNGTKSKKKAKIPKLPAHLAAKVKDPKYDMDTDTALTDEEIALLEAWKQAKEEGASGGKPRRKKKVLPPGVAEDLSDMTFPDTSSRNAENEGKPRIDDIWDKPRLLFPHGKIPTGVANFCVLHSPALLDGFVKQTSPACAAASTAGAWNALLGLHRHDKGAVGQDEVVAIMVDILKDRVAQKQEAVNKVFGAAEVTRFFEEYETSFASDGMTPYIWEKGKQAGDMLPRVRRVIAAAAKSNNDYKVIHTALSVEDEKDRAMKRKRQKDKSTLGIADTGDIEEDIVDEDEGDGSTASDKSPIGSLIQLIAMKSGLAKLLLERPSTSFFGNDGILQAIKMLKNNNPPIEVHASLFMGKAKDGKGKDGTEVQISSKDGPSTIAAQWQAMRDVFMSYNSVLLFHQTNHYSLIYGMREWMTPSGVKIRQCLTAKRGQSPTAWLDFMEVRRILLSWGGYRMIQIQRLVPKTFIDDWKVGALMDVHKGPDRVPTPPQAEVAWDNWERFIK